MNARTYTPSHQAPTVAGSATGVTMTPRRADALRALLRAYPYVLVIEDDHFSMLSAHPYESLIAPGHERFALIRSVSKFLGPDMCLAVAATDPTTAERLAMRLSPGTTWVSHLLQRLTHAQLTDARVRREIADAATHYAARNAAFAALLTDRGLPTGPGDGLNLWVELPVPARDAAEQLMRRGWLARTGDEFVLASDRPSHHLRLTVHDLTEDDARRLADDLAAACA